MSNLNRTVITILIVLGVLIFIIGVYISFLEEPLFGPKSAKLGRTEITPENICANPNRVPAFFPIEVRTGEIIKACNMIDGGLMAETGCSADLDGDGEIDPSDLAILLGNWGSCEDCLADLDDDRTVGSADLAILLGSWGPCTAALEYSLEISVATLKKKYEVGEDVDLTDPPIDRLADAISQVSEITARENRIDTIISKGREQTISGELLIIYIDRTEDSEIKFYLKAENGVRYELYFETPVEFSSGITLQISGYSLDDEFAVLDYSGQAASGGGNPSYGEQRLVVIMVNSQENPIEPLTREEIEGYFFSESQYFSVNRYYREASYENAWFTGDVFGVYSLSLDLQELCHFFNLMDAAIEASDDEVDFSQYDRMLVHSPYTNCGFSWGTVGSHFVDTDDGTFFMSQAIVTAPDEERIFRISIHELGHNLGARHSAIVECGEVPIGDDCDLTAGSDYFDPMGSGELRHFNSIHKDNFGWYETGNVLETNELGQYTIEPTETPGSGIKALKIPVNNRDYYVEFRRPLGYDVELEGSFGLAVYDGALITWDKFSDGADTLLLDATPHVGTPAYSQYRDSVQSVLPLGEIFYDPANELILMTTAVEDDFLEVTIGLPNCGNGVINQFEDCDGGNLGVDSCETIGYAGGVLNCNEFCLFDTSECGEFICGEGNFYRGGNSCTAIIPSHYGDNTLFVEGESPTTWDDLRFRDSADEVRFSGGGSNRLKLWSKPNDVSTLDRTSLPFDTSSIPETILIESAEITLARVDPFETNTHPESDDFVTIVPTTLQNPPFLSIGDFNQFSSVDNPIEVSRRLDVSEEWDATESYLFPLNEQGVEHINTEGFTTFGLRGGYDLSTTPNNGDLSTFQVNFRSGSSSFGKPTLTIYYIVLPKSQIINNEFEDVSGLLTMKIQERRQGAWTDYDIILEDSFRTVPARGVMALDLIWNPLGWEIPESGRYRVVVEFNVNEEIYRSEYEFLASS